MPINCCKGLKGRRCHCLTLFGTRSISRGLTCLCPPWQIWLALCYGGRSVFLLLVKILACSITSISINNFEPQQWYRSQGARSYYFSPDRKVSASSHPPAHHIKSQIKSSGVIVIVNYMTCDLLHVRMEALCLPPGISWLNTNLATSV